MRPRVVVISIDGFAAFYWDDPRARLPRLRRLAERGAIATSMEAVFPTTTWPTHVSMVTGVSPRTHGVVANHILNRETRTPEDLTGDPIYDAPDLLRAPTVYDVAHRAGLRTAAVDWPATRNATTLDFNLPFFKDQRVFETQTARAVWEELSALGYPMHRQGEWALLPKRFHKDEMVGRVAAHVTHRHEPALLLLHFLCVDSFQHLYGPRSPEAYWALEYVDGLIGSFLDSLPASGLDEVAVFVVSDHGFLDAHREIRPNVRLRKLGAQREARFVMNHGAGALYRLDADSGAVDQLAREIATMEGVSGMWPANEYEALGLPAPADHHQVADVMFEAAPGYSYGDAAEGPDEHGAPKYLGTHGQRPIYADNAAFFLAVGAGIRRGVPLGQIRSRDVAPTIAATLNLRMDAVEGAILTRALD
ncbi:MAG TPA: ectonucleotide pyrophosphatase/phosphodiesterase [Methylomirabilota bacterium]|jgi:predicted AlkP superfamily pyrophosphatase or phosphodiesterase|nr:ectonucleotide pyrophosphatase/phosphodiesterase [Methylomirabilota bacterium]